MLNELRRWLSGGSPNQQALAALSRWAQGAGHAYKPVRDNVGGVVEGGSGASAWRAEWGEPLRSYVSGPELRLIAEPGLPKDLQILVINRDLAETLERAMFEQAVDDVQTRIDADSPPEARWLVMHPKLGASDMGALRLRYAALGNLPSLVAQWLASPLGEALAATLPRVASTEPVVLMVGRGRLTLRTAMNLPDSDRLTLWHDLFSVALEQVLPIGQAWREADRKSRHDSSLPAEASTLGREPDAQIDL